MYLRQLQYVLEVANNGLSITKAASKLNTSQPGVSQQIRALENLLGIEIFTRDKNRLIGLTLVGQSVVEYAQRAIYNIEGMYIVANASRERGERQLRIATGHTQARYVLPEAVDGFVKQHPGVTVSLVHASPIQIMNAVASGEVDLGISPEADDNIIEGVFVFQAREHRRVGIAPRGHPLIESGKATLAQVAEYPLILGERLMPGYRRIMELFASTGLKPRTVLNVVNADVMKTYVARGLGVSLLPEITFDPQLDQNLGKFEVVEPLPPTKSNVVIKQQGTSIHAANFLKLFAPQGMQQRQPR